MAESKSVKDVDEGDYVMIDGHPCMVLEVPDDEEAECKISGQDVLDGTEHTHTYSGDDTIQTFTPTYEECEVDSVDDTSNTIYLVDGTSVPGHHQGVATQLYEEITQREDRGETSKVTANIITAMGRKAALFA